MDSINIFISSLVDNFELTRNMLIVIIGIVVMSITSIFLFLISRVFDPRNKRLGAIIHEEENDSSFARFSSSVETISTPNNEAEKNSVQDRLLKAGFRSSNALSVYYSIKLLLVLGLALAAILVVVFVPNTLTDYQIMFVIGGSAAVGIIIPSYYLDRKVQKRSTAIMRGLPDFLDLLVTCTEAGLGLNQALHRVADEIRVGYPELSGEVDIVNAEIAAGKERTQALKGLYTRTGLDDIRGLVSMFNQTLRFGTSIADALRIYAEEFRDKRMQVAEEKAAKLGTKMIFPLVFCFFPAFFIVAIGPAVFKIIAAFAQMNG